MISPDPERAFDQIGPDDPISPVILSVPHAGRSYPQALIDDLRLPVSALRTLEDRLVDSVALAARGSETMLVQRLGRAWIDLNRAEDERDPLVERPCAIRQPVSPSGKVRQGIGLIPRRIAAGELWRRRLSSPEVEARIAQAHRPYHATLARLIARVRARFGVAILIDLHSMPPLGARSGGARIVIGDRFGRTAGSRLIERMEAVASTSGWPHALNIPYAGGHILQRHGCPQNNCHAVQIELDRSLYLDAALDQPGPGLAETAALVRQMIDAALDAQPALPVAAE